jgi:hypothetical protein
MFNQGTNRQVAADLRSFFQEQHGRALKLNGEEWWIDGLVQLQGRLKRNRETVFDAGGVKAFVWRKTGVSVGRTFHKASWLQGTVWTAPSGETNGWLVWHYADGSTNAVPLVYGRNIARFWGRPSQIKGEKDFTDPVWRHYEDEKSALKERWVRLYRQEWSNPRPQDAVASLDFVSNPESRAAPFLIAVNVYP